MVLINILDHVERCYSNEDGRVIFYLINSALDNNEEVTVSFQGVKSVPSSFVNSAFIDLLEIYDFHFIKNKVNFVSSTRQINDMIKKRFRFEVQNLMTV